MVGVPPHQACGLTLRPPDWLRTALILRAGHLVLPFGRLPARHSGFRPPRSSFHHRKWGPLVLPGVSLLGTALILQAGHLVLPSGRLPARSGNSTKQKCVVKEKMSGAGSIFCPRLRLNSLVRGTEWGHPTDCRNQKMSGRARWEANDVRESLNNIRVTI